MQEGARKLVTRATGSEAGMASPPSSQRELGRLSNALRSPCRRGSYFHSEAYLCVVGTSRGSCARRSCTWAALARRLPASPAGGRLRKKAKVR